jgi:hypothetical protein
MSMKNSSDTIGNRTHDLSTCSAVPQPTALLRAPHKEVMMNKYEVIISTTESYRTLWNLTRALYKRNDGRKAFHPE